MDETSYCFTQANTALQYLTRFSHEQAAMKAEDFIKKASEEAVKKNIKFDPSIINIGQ